MISTIGKHGMKLSLIRSNCTSIRPLQMIYTKSSDRSTLCGNASSHSRLLMVNLICSLPSITSDLFDVEDRSRGMLDSGEKYDEDSLFFDFSLTQNPRIVLGHSPKRRSISSFVHAKEEGNPPKPHTPKKYF